jgi:hypothetical protein
MRKGAVRDRQTLREDRFGKKHSRVHHNIPECSQTGELCCAQIKPVKLNCSEADLGEPRVLEEPSTHSSATGDRAAGEWQKTVD